VKFFGWFDVGDLTLSILNIVSPPRSCKNGLLKWVSKKRSILTIVLIIILLLLYYQ